MIDDPEQLRARAADMRARAERAQFPETKQGLLRIADDYDVLAKRAEQRIAWWAAKSQQDVFENVTAVEAPAAAPPPSEDQSGSEGEITGQPIL